MEQEPGEVSFGKENIAQVERGQQFLAEQTAEFEGLENIRPEVIAKAEELFLSLGR